MPDKHRTIPAEPDEMPVQPERPEIKPPGDPGEPRAPEEAPGHAPQELPPPQQQPPETAPGKTDEAEERATGKGSMQDSVAAELKNRGGQ